MAKLDGVQTLDMVNGEITKVAYNGAEYVKTDEAVKEGDLFQLREGHFVDGGEVGAFYTTSTYYDGDIVIPTESVGCATYTQSQGWGVAYRKISTSKPKLKAGDFVKFEEPDLLDITIGKIYEVQTDDDGDLCIIDDAGDEDYSYLAEFAVKVDADEAKWAKIGRKVDEYKVGDLVVITEYCGGATVGEIVKVSRTREQSDGNTRIYYEHHKSFIRYTAHYGSYTLIAPVESTLN